MRIRVLPATWGENGECRFTYCVCSDYGQTERLMHDAEGRGFTEPAFREALQGVGLSHTDVEAAVQCALQ